MGTFRIEIQAVGGHGCQRDVKAGGTLQESCGYPETCPDCFTRAFVRKFQKYNNVESAKLIHWPENEHIVDDLLTNIREKSF